MWRGPARPADRLCGGAEKGRKAVERPGLMPMSCWRGGSGSRGRRDGARVALYRQYMTVKEGRRHCAARRLTGGPNRDRSCHWPFLMLRRHQQPACRIATMLPSSSRLPHLRNEHLGRAKRAVCAGDQQATKASIEPRPASLPVRHYKKAFLDA